jgi:hypothetical protein
MVLLSASPLSNSLKTLVYGTLLDRTIQTRLNQARLNAKGRQSARGSTEQINQARAPASSGGRGRKIQRKDGSRWLRIRLQ